MQFFFMEIGEERFFRYRSREATEETPNLRNLSPEEKARYRIFQGHLPYGDQVHLALIIHHALACPLKSHLIG